MQDNNSSIAVVSYCYAVEVSPTIKNICSYLYENGFGVVDIYVDQLYREKSFAQDGANVIVADSESSVKTLLKSLFGIDNRQQAFEAFLERNIADYSLVFAVDFISLHIVHSTGFDLGKVVFLSLEGIDYMRDFTKEYAAKLVTSCAFSIVQSQARGNDIGKYLQSDINFEYLPVSLRPAKFVSKKSNDRLKILYSGYFAEWACLLEFLQAFKQSKSYELSDLTLHGHAVGTEEYLNLVRQEASTIPGVEVNTLYFEEVKYSDFVAAYDIGVAFYKNISGTGNFENLILSSGKIASYLWSGLAVITNVGSQEAQTPPFIVMEEPQSSGLRKSLEYFKANRSLFRDAAYDLACKNYNFDMYMQNISKRALGLFAARG